MTRKRANNAGIRRGARGKKRGLQGVTSSGPKAKAQRTGSFSSQLRQAIKEVKSEVVIKKKYNPDKRLGMIIGFKKFSVYDDYSCTLNQTNIGQNNNKFYLIQLIEVSRKVDTYICYTRWGRVGEEGQCHCEYFCDVDQAIKAFRSKFKSKTSNDWNNRWTFVASPKKYVLLEMADEDDEVDSVAKSKNSVVPDSKLHYRTQIMIKLIFSDEMFLSNMQGMNIDVKKMPLGKLSKVQIVKGLECLLEIEKAIKDRKGNNVLMELSSKYYTIVPHDFGRNVPQTINLQSVVDTKKENMMILSDIELAQSLQDKKRKGQINEIDENYEKLKCDLVWIPKSSQDYKIIEKYIMGGKAPQNIAKRKLLDIWRVDREGEYKRFNAHYGIEHRKLLWHGTNIAVIAAILKAGLRIMPHSGGCVGRGIYFASEFTKSRGYVRQFWGEFENEKNVGFMFLTEVALGRTKEIMDGSCSSVTAAPKGYDSIVARGQHEPDEKKDLIKKFDQHEVIIPYGPAKKQHKFERSSFWQSEYLIYKESQAKIRYMLKFGDEY